MNPAHAFEAAACELRVLGGHAQGASAVLQRGQWVRIGHALSSDLVIRDPAAKGLNLRLRPHEDTAELDLIEGEISLLGHSLTGPATAILPAYVPLVLGASAVAFGAPDHPRWADAKRLLNATQADADPTPANEDEPWPQWRIISPVLSTLGRFQVAAPIAAGALAAVLLAAASWGAALDWLNSAPSPDQAGQALARDGFANLRVEASDHGLLARGLLPRSSDLARLRDDVAHRRWPMTLAVQTNDQLVQGVADVLRANGYDATVKALGPGLLAADVHGGDPTRLEAVRNEALRDNPGLKALAINGQSGEGGGESRSLLPNDPNKRVVAVVGGEMGYVQTADGSRYFNGSTLPTGHKITAIADQDVTVQLNGATTHLKF